MLNAIAAVHLRNGLWNTSGGVELPLVYAAAAAALVFSGEDMVGSNGQSSPGQRRGSSLPRSARAE